MSLPYYGPKEVLPLKEGQKFADTLYHTVPSFSFVNQNGDTITDKKLKGTIYVADFIFTTCQSICPKMTTNLAVLQSKFTPQDSVFLLSHTVNPSHDSVAVLKQYAAEVHATAPFWYFLTGSKKELYDIAYKGYLLNAVQDTSAANIQNQFLHDNHVVLVDKEGHLRGIYDGTSLPEINKLIDDIHMLKADYVRKAERKKVLDSRKSKH